MGRGGEEAVFLFFSFFFKLARELLIFRVFFQVGKGASYFPKCIVKAFAGS